MSEQYHVVLHESYGPNDLGEISEMTLYVYIRTRLHGDLEQTEAVLRELEEKGEATVRFGGPLGDARLEIRRQ